MGSEKIFASDIAISKLQKHQFQAALEQLFISYFPQSLCSYLKNDYHYI